MKLFIRKPSIDLMPGIKVDKDTLFEYQNDNVYQKIENMTMHSVTKVAGAGYKSVYDTTIQLKEGDVLIFEEEGRGYIKPVEEFVTIGEAIEDLKNIEGLG